MADPTNTYQVEFPAGGTMTLISPEEVDLFERAAKRYREDYALTKMNDLVLVGAILTQQVVMYRAQQRLSKMALDPDKMKPADLSAAQSIVTKCAEEIRDLEKALGIDKKTRDAGGQHTVANYVENLKRAAHQYGVRITERIKEYEGVMKEASWKLRLLENGDAEDLQHHDLTPDKFITWLRRELERIEEQDKDWAKTKGKIYAGKL